MRRTDIPFYFWFVGSRPLSPRTREHPATKVVAHNERFTVYSLLEGNLCVAVFSQHGRRGGQRGGSRRDAAEDSRRAAAQWRRDGEQLRGFAGAGQFVSFNVATARNKGGVADDTALGAAIDAAATTCDGALAWTPKLNVLPRAFCPRVVPDRQETAVGRCFVPGIQSRGGRGT